MRYEASIRAYDVMDQVALACCVWLTSEHPHERPMMVLSVATTVTGEGISDPRDWLRESLIALVETL